MSLSLDSHGSGPPLVVVHGATAPRVTWTRAIPLLAEARTVHALDVPGFGSSEPVGEGFDIAAVAAAIAASVVEEIDPPFDLLGSGLGGALALSLAARRPELVRRLVLCSPAGFRPLPASLARLAARAGDAVLAARRRAARRLAGRATARRALLAGLVDDAAGLSGADARMLLESTAGASRLRPALAAAAAAAQRADVIALRRPLGLLWGSADRVVPAMTAERILELRPDAPIELIPDAAHVPQLERPAQFAAAVERVLERTPEWAISS